MTTALVAAAASSGGTVDFTELVERLTDRFPGWSREQVASVVMSEYEAMTAGIPLVVPAGVEDGAAEMLDRRPRPCLRAVTD